MNILGFLLGAYGRMAMIGLALSAFVAWRVSDVHNQRALGEQRLAAKIEKATNVKIKKSDAARRAVDRVPDERMRDKFFRD